jgi:hypothetical protein
MSNKFDLSIVIVNFNTKAITLACLQSLYQYTVGIDFEVIVVDNASTDDSVAELNKFGAKHHTFKLILSPENRGFGVGNNLGAKEAVGKYLLFLNSDTLFVENNLSYCLGQMRKYEDTGVYSCNLTNKDGSRQPSGGFFPNLKNLFAWQLFLDDLPLIAKLFLSIHPHSSQSSSDWVTGAFMIIPAKLFQEVGGFDEKIFMYVEELELCYRIKKLGKKVVLDSHTSLIHLGGASGGSHLAITSEIKGMLYFWQKHKPKWQLFLVKFIFWVGSLLRYLIFGIIMANATHRKSYRQALGLVS